MMPSPSLRTLTIPGLVLVTVAGLSGCGSSTHADGFPRPRSDSPRNTLTAADIEANPDLPLERLLSARVSGLDIVRTPEGDIAIQIRGATTTNFAPSWPLYVMDGLPMLSGPNGAMPRISLDDIASIEVLKDPGATAIYGATGGSGVIVIRTKRGQRSPD